MRNFLTVTAVLVTLAAFGGTAPLAADRVALVIGNNDYKALPDLMNARNDASAVAAELRKLGWDVILRLDAGQRDMGRAIETFEGRLATADAGLVFYAGHGVQARGENWLVPADAVVESEVDLKYEGISARDILEAMKRSGVPLNIVILDACRDNPLRKTTRSVARGLAVPALPQGIKGTAVLFSAAPGETAEDGPAGGHGVFTGALLATLETPGLTLEELFKRTARRVSETTANRQRPWFNTSVFGDFYVNPAGSAVTGPAPEPAAGAGGEAEIVFWQSIANATRPELFDSYLEQYPNGAFAPLARAKLRLLRGEPAERPVARSPERVPERAPEPPRGDVRAPAGVAALPKVPAPSAPSDAERAKVEALLVDSRDVLRRKLSRFMLASGNAFEAVYEVEYIWKMTLLDATPEGYVVKIHYQASVDPARRDSFTRTQRFRMRLAGNALEYVALLPDDR